MATQLRAEPGVQYKNPVTGQEVSYTQDQLQDPAAGFITDQFQPIQSAPQTPIITPTPSSMTTSVPQGARKLGPREYESLRLQNKVSPANFDQFFYKDPTGGIYLKPSASSAPTDTRQQDETVEDFTTRLAGESATGSVQTSSNRFVGTSDQERARVRERLKSELLPLGAAPEMPSLAEERIKLRKEQGIINDEQDLSDLRNESRLIEQELRQFRSTAGQGVSEFGRAGAVSEAERNAMFRMEGLAIRERALVERVNSKNAYIDQAIKDRQFDYAAATDRWNQEFTINSKVNELLNTEMDDIQKDALATVTTISNLMGESGTPYDQWPSEMKIQVETAALRAGLPKDTFKAAYGALKSDEKVISEIVQTNPEGGKDLYILTQNKQGQFSFKKAGSISRSGIGNEEGKLTDEQRKATGYAARLQEANSILNNLNTYLSGLSLADAYYQKYAPNPLKSPEYQQFEQAQRNFINAQLRRESGAVISEEEFKNAEKQYFPQPGDSTEVLKQKEANRQTAIESMIFASGSGADNPLANPDADFDALRNDPELKDYSDDEIRAILGKTNEGSVSNNAEKNSVTSDDSGLSPLARSIVEQESGGNYGAVGQETQHGRALGKYQIIPKFHFSKIGLSDTATDRKKFLETPQLQDELFKIIIDDLNKKHGGDPMKVVAAYYGGDGAAAKVGTAAGDVPQKAGGKRFPSINEYARSVVNRMKNYS